jgi:phytoene dehydrogenase-like protein
MTDTPIHVIGGGLAGLVAAITAADGGATVVLHEADATLGGRARSGAGPYGVNLGPHVVYRDGAVVRFLRTRGLRDRVRLRPPRSPRIRVLDAAGEHGPVRLARAVAAMAQPRQAPVDVPFDRWAHATFGERTASDLCHIAGLYTFHHDPGSLSAAFVWDGCVRTLGHPYNTRYIGGGWTTLVRALAAGARERGVRIELGSPLDAGSLPDDGPVIVATAPPAAEALLERDLSWPSARTALLDLALADPGRLAFVAFDLAPDLAGCCMAERFTANDSTLAPAGVELVQAQLGIAADVELDDAVERMERTVDGLGDWRGAEVWRRAHVVTGASGAVDPPGTTWRDRPPVDQGEGRYLAGDAVAAPGLLSEVSVNSAVRAAHLALADRRERQWAPGWPTVDLPASDRARILAAAIPGATVSITVAQAQRDEAWTAEPVAEVEPWRTHQRTPRGTRITGADVLADGGTALTTVRVPRRSG